MTQEEKKYKGKSIETDQWVFGVPYYIKSEKVAFIINNCTSLNFTREDTTFTGIPVHPESIELVHYD